MTAMVVASTALTAGSQVVEGVAANRAAQYNASVMRTNAIIARQKADQERQSGDLEARRAGEQASAATEAQAARFAAGGVQLASGSPADVLVSAAEQGMMDAAIIRANSQQRQSDLAYEANNLEQQAIMEKRAGKAQMYSSFMQAGGSVLGGASSLMGPGSSMSKPFGGRYGRQTQVGSMGSRSSKGFSVPATVRGG